MKMTTKPATLAFLICCFALSLLVSSCGKEPFNSEAPYAVLVGKYRSWQVVKNFKERLKKEGLPVYIKTLQEPESGKWFGLFLGSSAVLEEMMAMKIDFEDKFGLHDLEIVNFNQMADQILSADPHFTELIENELAQWPVSLQQISRLLPYRSNFQISHFSYFQPLHEVSFQSFPELRKTSADLPRGISTQQLLRISEGFAEAVYSDPLHDLQFTVDLAILKKGSQSADSLNLKFAKEILNTRYYEVEELHDTEVETQEGIWTGYMVSITPKKNQVNRYLLLSNPQKDKLLFVQASSQSANQLLYFSEKLGSGKNILSYENVHNSLYLLSPQPNSTDVLAHLQLDVLEELKGQNGRFLEGHSRTIYRYHHPEDGLWEARFTFMNEAEQSQRLFKSIFARNARFKDSVAVNGSYGLIAYEKNTASQKKRLKMIPEEVQLYSPRYLGFISNSQKSELDRADLLKRTECFRLDAPIEAPGFFSALSSR